MVEPTEKEIVLSEHDFIISKTDTKGKITYGNQSFIYYSGYREDEILGKPHNIIRHPDMPRSVFRLMWQTLQKGEEFFGYVKNLRKDGGYYWTFANVTPSYAPNGQLIGYYSVRRKPEPDRLTLFAELYQQMVAMEKKFNSSKAAMDASFRLLEDTLGEISYHEFIAAN